MRRHSSPAALALVFLAATAAADVLHLHDGTRITGNVTACDEEQCTVDKRQVPFTDIARITLGSSSPPRATNRGEGVVLKDGAFRSGKFTGLTLGYVEIGAEEIDRADVAEIVLIAVNRPDVIIGIDGAARTGALTTCNAASCTLDARAIALPDIRWIGLAPEDATPPQAGDADLVFTGEDATPGRLSGLDETTVRTTRGSFPRDRVTWIRLAPPPAPQPTAQPPIYRPSPDPPSPPPPRRPDAPGSPSTEPRTPSTEPPSSGSTPPASSPRRQRPPIGRRLWIGEMQGYLWGAEEGNAEDLRVFVDVRLQEIGKRELTDGAGKKIGELIMLSAAGSVVRNTHRYRGIDRCDGEGTVTVADEGAGTFANSLFRKTAPGAMPGVFGDEVPVGKELYMLWVGPTNRMFPVVCYDESGSRSTTLPYIVPMAGTLPTGTVSFDPHLRYLQDGKMIGSYTVTGDAQMYGNVSRTNASLSWSICLEDTVCPPVVPPQEPRRGENDPLAPRDLPAGTDWCAEVERLLQLLRTEQSKLLGHQKAVRDAEMEVGAALDVIWGWDGAMRKYFTSLLSL